MRRSLIAGGLALASVLLGVSSAEAQMTTTGVNVGRFNPAPAGDRMFGVPSPFVAGDPALHVMLLGDYAHNPLVLVRTTGDTEEDAGSVLEHQMYMHLNANLALWHRLAINADIPVAIFQGGDDDLANGAVTAPTDPSFGDLRLGARVRLYGEYFDPFQLGLGGYVWLPSGDESGYTSDGAVRGMPHLLLGGRADRFLWTFATGPEFREAQPDFLNVATGGLYYFGGGLGFLLGEDRQVQLGLELSSYLNFEGVNERTTNAELLLDGRYRIGDFEMGAGIGPGLTSGIGTPDVRAVFMFAYTPEMKEQNDRDGDGIFDDQDACPDVPGVADPDPAKNGCPPPGDRDNDGILDPEDACPDVPGVADPDPKKNGCPKGDRDKDGILDEVDACPDEPGVASDDPAKNGCPPDRDGDGVYDKDDACPDIPGIKTNDPATNGCPGDTDGDGIRDDKDACPKEKGVADPDPTKNGCPKLVRVTDTEVVILQQVQFDTGRATIRRESDALLDEVAGVLKAHPEITKLEVQGHTDNRGSKQLNAKLSDDRAKAVREALVKRGVAAERLTSKGYGPDKPIADNATDDGRQKNRRVQFIVTEKKPAAN